MKEEILAYESRDGLVLNYYHWNPKKRKIRAVLILLHGMSEHAGRYRGFARRLCQMGLSVYAPDHRGHGMNLEKTGAKGHFANQDGWGLFMDDIGRLHQEAVGQYPGKEIFLLGHSMGSIAARTYALNPSEKLSALMLSGTPYTPPMALKFGNSLAHMGCLLGKGNTESRLLTVLTFGAANRRIPGAKSKLEWLNRSRKEILKYKADPLCGFMCTSAFYRDMTSGLELAQSVEALKKTKNKMPVYLFAGLADPVGYYGKGVTKAFNRYKKAGFKDVTLKLYPKSRHEVLFEKNYDEVQEDLMAWLENHLLTKTDR